MTVCMTWPTMVVVLHQGCQTSFINRKVICYLIFIPEKQITLNATDRSMETIRRGLCAL